MRTMTFSKIIKCISKLTHGCLPQKVPKLTQQQIDARNKLLEEEFLMTMQEWPKY